MCCRMACASVIQETVQCSKLLDGDGFLNELRKYAPTGLPCLLPGLIEWLGDGSTLLVLRDISTKRNICEKENV